MEEFLTPDGVFRIEFQCVEMRMSHSVCNPKVIHRPSGEVLLDRFDTMDDGQPSVDDEGRLHLDMRTYPGTEPGTKIIYDPREGTVTYVDGDKSETFVHNVLMRHATRSRGPEPAAPDAPVPETPAPRPSAPSEPPIRPPSRASSAACETPRDDIRDCPPSRWRAYVYPLIFYAAFPAVMLAAWLVSRTPPFKRLPRLAAAGLIEMAIIAALLIGGFVFMLWLYRGKRV